eukprot:scaffold139954_cov16-Prasinocladus_malaysianus.AAC.1
MPIGGQIRSDQVRPIRPGKPAGGIVRSGNHGSDQSGLESQCKVRSGQIGSEQDKTDYWRLLTTMSLET